MLCRLDSVCEQRQEGRARPPHPTSDTAVMAAPARPTCAWGRAGGLQGAGGRRPSGSQDSRLHKHGGQRHVAGPAKGRGSPGGQERLVGFLEEGSQGRSQRLPAEALGPRCKGPGWGQRPRAGPLLQPGPAWRRPFQVGDPASPPQAAGAAARSEVPELGSPADTELRVTMADPHPLPALPSVHSLGSMGSGQGSREASDWPSREPAGDTGRWVPLLRLGSEAKSPGGPSGWLPPSPAAP